jgi:HPt (histidine-containing phosphotransfer) domain-containing protein
VEKVMIIVDPTEMLGLLDIHPGWGGSTEEEQSIAENNFYICIRYLINKMTQSDINIYRDHFTEICTIIVKHNTNPEMHPADHIPVWFCPNLLVGAITLKDTQLCEEIKSAFPSLKELDDDKLLTEVQPYLDEIEDMVDSKALETAAEREAFLSLVQHPETWVSDTLLPRPPLESAGQQEAFLDMMRMFCHRVPEREESTTEASAREKHGIESVLRASVHVQGTKRKAEESAEGLRSAKRGYGTSV